MTPIDRPTLRTAAADRAPIKAAVAGDIHPVTLMERRYVNADSPTWLLGDSPTPGAMRAAAPWRDLFLSFAKRRGL